MNVVEKKVREERGIALLVVLTGILLAAALMLIIFIPGYARHLENARLTMDVQSVDTARDVALITYLQDGVSGLETYYYDELNHCCVHREDIASIRGYGRSEAEKNLNAQTGAVGIPSLPERDGGPQLLAITLIDESINNIRWTGHVYTYWDYVYMTEEERSLLQESDKVQMDRSSELTALGRAQELYEKTYRKQLKRDENPGTAIYNYDLVHDIMYLDPACEALPAKGQTYRRPDEIQAYSLSDAVGGIVQVTVEQNDISAKWKEGNHTI